MLKPLNQALICIMMTALANAALADPVDRLTGLPLYPNMQFATTASKNVCGTKVTSSTYSATDGTIASVDGWYARHLKGFHIVHGTSRSVPGDIYVNSEATTSISISSAGATTAVDVVVYNKNPMPAVAPILIRALNNSNVVCH